MLNKSSFVAQVTSSYPLHNYVYYATVPARYKHFLAQMSSLTEPTSYKEASQDPNWCKELVYLNNMNSCSLLLYTHNIREN